MATTFKRTSLCWCLGLLTAVGLGPARADQTADFVPRILERPCRLGAQAMQAAMNVGALLSVEPLYGPDYAARFLGRRGVVQVDQRLTFDPRGKDRKLIAQPGQIGGRNSRIVGGLAAQFMTRSHDRKGSLPGKRSASNCASGFCNAGILTLSSTSSAKA